MELLLILSAMFSALTGVLGTRAPQPQSHQVAIVRAAARVVQAQRATLRPLALPMTLAQSAFPRIATAFVRFTAVPLYATRRRE